ncbi:MAG: hypothetical protein CSA11_01695 [Chloroflexi bacterium]|nr:MAG: hypothetical protein CSA11_01695 [Chloroflexota bacterium]
MLDQTPTTIPSELRDFPEWHHGRERYGVWVLRCDEYKGIQEMFKAARAHLKGYLLEPYHRQPHITLFACGFLVAENRYNDDVTQAQLDAQVQALDKANVQPFEIEIGRLNSFASAPFLEVGDSDGGIPRLREALAHGVSEFRTTPYRPHLTVGLYTEAFSSEQLLASMAAFSREPIRWRVEQVTLATYQARVHAGKLSYEYDVALKS